MDLRISNRTQNLKKILSQISLIDPDNDFQQLKSVTKSVLFCVGLEIRKIQILRSKSGFPNRKQPNIILDKNTDLRKNIFTT